MNVDTIDSIIKRAPRRKHSAELRTKVLQACSLPGASVAGVALLHGLNANVVHRWRVDERNAAVPAMQEAPSGFLAVNIIPETCTNSEPLPPADIRVEVTRANATIVVKWPLQDSAACAVWLREWLLLNSY